jgi:hypothetical protein
VKREIDGFVLNRLQVALLTEAFTDRPGGRRSPEDLDHTIADGLGCAGPSWAPSRTIELTRRAAGPTTASAIVGPWFRSYLADLPAARGVERRRGAARPEAWGPAPQAGDVLREEPLAPTIASPRLAAHKRRPEPRAPKT